MEGERLSDARAEQELAEALVFGEWHKIMPLLRRMTSPRVGSVTFDAERLNERLTHVYYQRRAVSTTLNLSTLIAKPLDTTVAWRLGAPNGPTFLARPDKRFLLSYSEATKVTLAHGTADYQRHVRFVHTDGKQTGTFKAKVCSTYGDYDLEIEQEFAKGKPHNLNISIIIDDDEKHTFCVTDDVTVVHGPPLFSHPVDKTMLLCNGVITVKFNEGFLTRQFKTRSMRELWRTRHWHYRAIELQKSSLRMVTKWKAAFVAWLERAHANAARRGVFLAGKRDRAAYEAD